MQPEFKRHEKVRLLVNPQEDDIEYDLSHENTKPAVRKGSIGKINMVLPNGQYHVEIIDEEGNTIAYVPIDGAFLEKVEE